MEATCYLLLRIEDRSRCGRWIGERVSEVTSGAEKRPEELRRQRTSMNVALTWSGLRVLGLPAEALETFPLEFQEGMRSRADILEDTGESAPECWEFGGSEGPAREGSLHVLLMLYGRTEADVEELLASQRGRLEAGGLRELGCQRAARKRDTGGHVVEHFGFRDGISQPLIEGFMNPDQHVADYDSPIKAGEFILGYENEYGEAPDPPCVPEAVDGGKVLPSGPRPGWRDLGRHGSYLVVRKLAQDVEGFERFLEAHQGLGVGKTGEEKRRWLAAKLLGRWPNGAPLRAGEDAPPEKVPEGRHGIENTFQFHAEDAEGYGCPVGSHVRRANPRDALPPGPEMSRKVSRRHRLLRRGITYEDETGRGLLFVALNASIERQFEFLQQTWLNSGKFGGRFDERDPLMARGGGQLTLPREPLRTSVQGLASFVTMRGGSYFFLPSLTALKFLAHLSQN